MLTKILQSKYYYFCIIDEETVQRGYVSTQSCTARKCMSGVLNPSGLPADAAPKDLDHGGDAPEGV